MSPAASPTSPSSRPSSFWSPYNQRPFIRFHSFQCLFLAGVGLVSNVLHIIPILGSILMLIISLVITVLWLIAMIQAFMGKTFVIPLIGPLAQQAAGAV